MEKRTRVIVYGRTLNMAGIAASLKAQAGLDVVCVDSRSSNARQRLDEIESAVITFDLSDPTTCLDVSLLCERPGLQLIGVDPSRDELMILSSQSARALSVADLVNVINQKVPNS